MRACNAIDVRNHKKLQDGLFNCKHIDFLALFAQLPIAVLVNKRFFARRKPILLNLLDKVS